MAAHDPAPAVLPQPYDPIFDPRLALGTTPTGFVSNAPIPLEVATAPAPAVVADASDDGPAPEATPKIALPPPSPAMPEVVAVAPMPVPRPDDLDAGSEPAPATPPYRPAVRQFAQRPKTTAPVAPVADNRSFFEKVFGALTPKTPGPALAYASPDDGGFSRAPSFSGVTSSLSADRQTAVYDIAAHTVYMPNGERLEAHSGLGPMLDNPRHVAVRMRGPTPPQVYELKEREALFHGVRALRLTPVGSGTVYGRTGLLAHTYMLGPNGDSNGCVSFRNYDAFLRAYLNGQVKRLSVVASRS